MDRMFGGEDKVFVAVAIDRFKPAEDLASFYGFKERVVFTGQSTSKDATFRITSNPLDAERISRYKRAFEHGFTIVELPANWIYGGLNSSPGNWQQYVIDKAVERIEAIQERRQYVSGYDVELADKVLAALDKKFPNPVSNMQLKMEIEPEPSDDELLTALAALQIRKLVDGKGLPDHTSGTRRLVAMMNITLTKEGHDELRNTGKPSPLAVTYNNFGQAGAMGPNSSGVVNLQSEWQQLQRGTDLQQLAIVLQTAIQEKRSSASTPQEFAELAMMADARTHAEQQDGSKVLQVLAQMGQSAVPILTTAGAKGLVAWLEHHTGTRLS